MTLDQLKAQEIEIRNALSENLEAQKKIQDDEEILLKTGVCVGAEIEFTSNGVVSHGIVSKVHNLLVGYWVSVKQIKKDGTLNQYTETVFPGNIISVKPKQK